MSLEEKEIKNKLYADGIVAFNEKNFYDAHEHWEDLWSDYILEDAKFIQALIQLSVGYFHITNNNKKAPITWYYNIYNNKNGAVGLLNKCLPKFELYKPIQRDVDVLEVLEIAQKALLCVQSIDKMSDFDWTLVPILNYE